MNQPDDSAAVTIQVPGGGQCDVSLPLHLRVNDAVLLLIPHLRESFAAHGRDTSVLDDKTARWQLVRGINDPLNSSHTLNDEGVMSGHTLRLVRTKAKETYLALVDDVPESIAQYQIERYKAWDSKATRATVGAIAPVASLGVSASMIHYVISRELNWIFHLGISAVLFAIAMVGILAAFKICRKTDDKAREASAPGSISAMCGFFFLIAAVAAAIPVTVSVWHLLACSIVSVTLAGLLRATTKGIESVAYAFMVMGGICLTAGAVSMLLPNSSLLHVASLGVGFSIVFLLFASSMALRAANVPTPFIPTLGESYVNPNENADLTDLPTSTSTEALKAIINREQQTIDAHNAILGMTAGGLAAIVLSMIGLAASMSPNGSSNPLLIWAFIVVVFIAMLFRAMAYEDMMTQAVWYVGIVSAALVVPLTLAWTGVNDQMLLLTCGVIVVVVLVSVFYVTRAKKVTSPLVKHRFEVFEFICYVAIFVLIALLVDVYAAARYA